MSSRTFILPLALLTLLIGVLHVAAIEFFLYWTLPWFDILLHFLGGMWVAALTFWFLFLNRPLAYLPLKPAVIAWTLIGVTLVVGAAWEVFEYLVSVNLMDNYALDTVLDLVMDVVGAVVLYYLMLSSRFRVVLE